MNKTAALSGCERACHTPCAVQRRDEEVTVAVRTDVGDDGEPVCLLMMAASFLLHVWSFAVTLEDELMGECEDLRMLSDERK